VMVPVAAAIGAAVAINAGYVVQHLGLATAAPIEPRRPLAAVAAILRSPRWVAGALLGYGGLGLELIALTALPLSTVQAVIGAGLVLVATLGRAPRGRAACLGAVLAVASLAILVAVTPAGGSSHTLPGPCAAALATATVAGAAALLLRHIRSAVGLALAAGMLYGLTSVAMAALAPILSGSWPPPAVVLAALGVGAPATIAAFLCFQRALQRGRPLAVVTAMMAGMDAVAMAGGLLLLGDPLATGAGGRVAQLGALALSALSALVVVAGSGRGRERQPEDKARAGVARLERDVAGHPPGELAGDRQPEAEAA
jgi:hypothetical protein